MDMEVLCWAMAIHSVGACVTAAIRHGDLCESRDVDGAESLVLFVEAMLWPVTWVWRAWRAL